MKNNNVFQVLVVSNPAILVAGSKLDDLLVGQIGIFNAETNLSIDAALAWPKKIYMAVGYINKNGQLDIRKSSGEFMETKNINSVFRQAPVAAQPQVFTLPLVGFIPTALADYVLRFTFMSGETMQLHGFDNPGKSFVVSTDTVAPALSLFQDMIVAEINKDNEHVVVATKSGTDVIFTIGKDANYTTIGGLNPKYNFLRQLKATLSLGGEFKFPVYPVVITGPVYELGSGYDIAQEEFIAGGWNGDPGIYRDSALTGLIGYSTTIFANPALKYNTIRFNYEFTSHSGGGLEYSNQLDTIVAIPVVSTDYDPLKTKINTGISVNGFVTTMTD